MSEKTKGVIYLVLFVIALIGVSIYVNYISKTPKQSIENTVQTAETTILEVTEDTFEDEVLNSDKKVLIDFYATWCAPCRVIRPRINEVAAEHPEIKVVSIDVDKAPNLSEKFKIYSIPTLVVIEDGNETNRAIGAIEEDKIVEILGIK